jgi:hypothetical protein
VTELGAGAPRESRPSPEHAADALAAVLDNATALARAEVRLAAAEARAWLVRIGFGLVALWLALLLLQVFVLVLALSPVLVEKSSWGTLGSVLALALVPAVIMSFIAARELRRLKDVRHGDLDQRESQRH